MSVIDQNNKRLAKNTVALYIRMLLVMAVTLYSSRIILAILGVEDFGIYNVVGGVITIIGVLNASFSSASSRFLTYEMGKAQAGDVSAVFHCSLSVHFIIAAVIFVLAETIGVWFVCNKLVIPEERLNAAFWVYQCSVLTVLIMIISTPYNALIIASEKMGVFALISIFEAAAKLAIVFLIEAVPFDRLVSYALLLLCVQIVVRFIYALYCRRTFVYFRRNSYFLWDRMRIREMASYAGWMMTGGSAYMGYTQGINILLNLFFGPVVNASRAIALQVQGAVNNFSTSIQAAVRPQVTKYYAQRNMTDMHRLVIYSSKYSFYLMLFIVLPLLVNTQYVLSIWLKEVPDYAVLFVQITLVTSLNYALSGPTMMAIHATGDIRKFQIIESSLLLSIIPIAYALLRFVAITPVQVLLVYLCIETITQFVRVWIVYPRVEIKISRYFKDVLFPIVKVCLCIGPFLYMWYNEADPELADFLVSSSCLSLLTILAVFTVGLNGAERRKLKSEIKFRYDRIFEKIAV